MPVPVPKSSQVRLVNVVTLRVVASVNVNVKSMPLPSSTSTAQSHIPLSSVHVTLLAYTGGASQVSAIIDNKSSRLMV